MLSKHAEYTVCSLKQWADMIEISHAFELQKDLDTGIIPTEEAEIRAQHALNILSAHAWNSS